MCLNELFILQRIASRSYTSLSNVRSTARANMHYTNRVLRGSSTIVV